MTTTLRYYYYYSAVQRQTDAIHDSYRDPPRHQVVKPPVPRQRVEERRVDVAAGEQRHDRPAAADLAGQKRRDADRARTLDDQLRALEQVHDRLADLLVRNSDQVVDHTVEDAHRQLAGLLHRDAVGNREARPIRERPGRLNADDAHARLHRAQRDRSPRR